MNSLNRLQKLLTEARSLPQEYDIDNLFDENRENPICVNYFVNLLDWYSDERIANRIDNSNLDGNCKEVWRRLNIPGHPVREGLILISNNLLDK